MVNRLFFPLASAICLLILSVSCSSQQGAVEGAPSAAAWRSGVKGQWVLQSIDKENFPTAYSVKSVFEEAPAECFVGSVWDIPNDGQWTIKLDAEGILCAPGAVRGIGLSISKPFKTGGQPQLQFKKIYPGD